MRINKIIYQIFLLLIVIFVLSISQLAAQINLIPMIGYENSSYTASLRSKKSSPIFELALTKKIENLFWLEFHLGFSKSSYDYVLGDLPSPDPNAYMYSFNYITNGLLISWKHDNGLSTGIGTSFRTSVKGYRSPLDPFEPDNKEKWGPNNKLGIKCFVAYSYNRFVVRPSFTWIANESSPEETPKSNFFLNLNLGYKFTL